MDAVLYIHGKGGSAGESSHYRPLFPGCAVLGLDHRGLTPWEAGAEIRAAVDGLSGGYDSIMLIANSIGAWFSLQAGLNGLIRQAFFISPILDMEGLILELLRQERVSEEELRAQGVIHTAFGEELSWDYLCYVRSHPIDWQVPTHILCGGRDELAPPAAARAFAAGHNATLTVMPNGEHWFHTEEQLRFLDGWIREKTAALWRNDFQDI
ncbi:MAG: alpha/beta hydrolase [Firmicutes bacterium]|nr:alpha/beta hydrolase [Bacillota bacterium]